MSKTALEKLIIEETRGLPSDVLIEIVDFIRFLKTQRLKAADENGIKGELNHLNKSSLAHLEEEFSNYKELYPRED